MASFIEFKLIFSCCVNRHHIVGQEVPNRAGYFCMSPWGFFFLSPIWCYQYKRLRNHGLLHWSSRNIIISFACFFYICSIVTCGTTLDVGNGSWRCILSWQLHCGMFCTVLFYGVHILIKSKLLPWDRCLAFLWDEDFICF